MHMLCCWLHSVANCSASALPPPWQWPAQRRRVASWPLLASPSEGYAEPIGLHFKAGSNTFQSRSTLTLLKRRRPMWWTSSSRCCPM